MKNFTKVLAALIFVGASSIFLASTASAQQWRGANSIEGDINRNGSIGIGITDPTYKLQLKNNAVNTHIMMLQESSNNPTGSSFFRIFAQDKSIFDVCYFSHKGFRTHLGVNYAINGNTGRQQYAVTGSKKAPFIELNADNGSVAIFGENGSGKDWRTASPKLGLLVNNIGNVGIGVTNPNEKLVVDGTIKAEELIVENVAADYVFGEGFNLRSLEEVESFIKENGHLPDVAPASETVKGIKVSEFSTVLLQKIEELTLYMIDMKKENEELKALISK